MRKDQEERGMERGRVDREWEGVEGEREIGRGERKGKGGGEGY